MGTTSLTNRASDRTGHSHTHAARTALAALAVATCLLSQIAQAAQPAATSAAQAATRQDDDATMRRDAWRDWYEGDPTPSYRKFLFDAAKAERHRRLNRSPHNRASATSAYAMATATPAWLNLGPTRADFLTNGVTLSQIDSGRIASIVVHPTDVQTIYVATAGGGVWKTTNGGQAWIPISDSLGALFTGSLEMDPRDPNTLYLGLGDFADDGGAGIGSVFKSSDGGATWSDGVVLQHQVGSTTSFATHIKQILAGPGTPGLLLAASDAGLFRSVDAGVSWSHIALPGLAPEVWSLAWTGGNKFALSLVDAGVGEVYVSNDSGINWIRAVGLTKPGGIQRVTLAPAPSNRAIVYALAANDGYQLADIFRSVDGGLSWAPLGADTKALSNPNAENQSMAQVLGYQGWYDQLALVSPTDANVVYFGGTVFLAQTADGGATFSQLTNWLAQFGLPYVHADFQCGTFDSAGNLYVGTDGGIFKSANGGRTWTSALNAGIVSHLVYSVGSSMANRDAVIGGLQDDGTRVRSGATSTFNQTLGGDGFGSNVHAVNPNQMLGSLYYSQIYRSNNGGASFFPAYSGINTSAGFFTKIVPALGDTSGNTVYTITNTTPYQSTDYAGHWTALGTTGLPDNTPLRNVGVSKANPQVLGLVVNGSRVYLSGDGGSSWAQTGPLPNSSAALSSIWFDTTNAQTIYVTSVARVPGTSHIWKSLDGGASWTSIDTTNSGIPRVPVNVLVNDPGNPLRLYAGTVFGLYQSDDGGGTWNVAGAGLPMADVTDIYVAPDSSFVRVSTYGRGFWELDTSAASQSITITPVTVPDGSVGLLYTPVFVSVTGGTGPYAYGVTAGALPGGLTLSSAGVLSGTPNMAGTYTFRMTVTDSTPGTSGGPLSGSRVYVMTILGTSSSSISLTPTSLPTGTFGTIYSPQLIGASGGTGPYRFGVTAGALPGGLVLTSSGILSGTPNMVTAYTFRLTATDSTPAAYGGPFSGSQNYAMTILRASQSIAFGALANKNLGDPDFSISATATSQLPVVFASLTPAVCSVNGSLVHLGSAGTCEIAADQNGDSNYTAANRVTQGFSVLSPDVIPPAVVAMTREGLTPTMSDYVYYTLEFSEPVSGLTIANFYLAAPGVAGAAVTAVYGGGDFWEVEVNTGRGSGTLQLNFTGGPEILDLAGNPLAAVSVQGEAYQVDKSVLVIGTGQGRPDTAFGNNGFALFSDAPIASPPSVAVLPDGRILAAGLVACQATNTGVGSCTLQLARYAASGAPDAAFGQNGRILTNITRVLNVDKLIANDDGSFYVNGVHVVTGGSANVAFVGRFTSDGVPDTSFGVHGLASLDATPLGRVATGSTLDVAGRVLVAGTTLSVPVQGTDVFVARLTPAGLLDASFGVGGIARFAVSTTGNRNDRGADVAVQPDGRIVVGGYTVGSAGSFSLLLLRLDSAGALDPTFGAGGITTTTLSASGSSIGRRLLLQPDGKIMLLGGAALQCGILRFQDNGALDASFGTGGKILLPEMSICSGITPQRDGKLVLTGFNFKPDNDLTYAAVERRMADGSSDPTFGTAGLIEITSYDSATRAAVTANGSLVTSVLIEDSSDGLQKSRVVKLAAELAQVTTTVFGAATPVMAVTGQPYTVAISVAAARGAPDGTVILTDDLGATCTIATLSAGTGACVLTPTAAGTRVLTALYKGSFSFLSSNATRTYVVGLAGTTTSVASNANPAPVGATVTFASSTVVASPGKGAPTGSVTFSNRNVPLGTAVMDASGRATFVTSALPVGASKIVAKYAGDANYQGSSSAELEQKIEKLPSVQFSQSTLKISESVGSVTLTVNRVGSVAGPVSVAFASVDGTAKAPLDYATARGTLSWAAGDNAPRTIAIPIVADAVPEPAETFSVTLSAPTGALLGINTSTVITILQN